MSLINKHLSTEILINLADEKLSGDEIASVKAHLKDCSKCLTEANKFGEIIRLMQKDDSKDAPQDSIVWAKNLFRSRITEPKKSTLQKVLAVLQMDLSKNQPAFGERSSATATRQMLFRAEEIGVTLRISNDENQISVKGQILGAEFEGCKVILSNNENSFSATANELSEFKIQTIPNGIYTLTIRNAEKEISVENLELS